MVHDILSKLIHWEICFHIFSEFIYLCVYAHVCIYVWVLCGGQRITAEILSSLSSRGSRRLHSGDRLGSKCLYLLRQLGFFC